MALIVSMAALGAAATAPPAGAAAPVRRANSSPLEIAAGPDGSLWFTELFGNRIGRITTSGAITEFPVSVPTGSFLGRANPKGIAAGPDGGLWFTSGGEIGRITTHGTITRFAVPGGDTPQNLIAGGLGGLTAGPDRALWFTYGSPAMIGRITSTGKATAFPIAAAGGVLGEIASGPDGALWFGDDPGSKIWRITTAGQTTEFVLPSRAGGGEFGIAAGLDGALWFTRGVLSSGAVRRITTDGVLTTFPLPTAPSAPSGITAGPDSAMWFAETEGDRIGRITTAGAVSEFAVPTKRSGPFGIVRGPDDALWFTERNADKIGRISRAGTVREFALPPLVFVKFLVPGGKCTSPDVLAMVKAKLLRNGARLARLTLLLDGRVVKRTTGLKFRLRLPVDVGRHTFKAIAVDTAGRRATFSQTYQRCRARR